MPLGVGRLVSGEGNKRSPWLRGPRVHCSQKPAAPAFLRKTAPGKVRTRAPEGWAGGTVGPGMGTQTCLGRPPWQTGQQKRARCTLWLWSPRSLCELRVSAPPPARRTHAADNVQPTQSLRSTSRKENLKARFSNHHLSPQRPPHTQERTPLNHVHVPTARGTGRRTHCTSPQSSIEPSPLRRQTQDGPSQIRPQNPGPHSTHRAERVRKGMGTRRQHSASQVPERDNDKENRAQVSSQQALLTPQRTSDPEERSGAQTRDLSGSRDRPRPSHDSNPTLSCGISRFSSSANQSWERIT